MWIRRRILDGVMAAVVRSYEQSLFCYLTFTISRLPIAKQSAVEYFRAMFFFIRGSSQRSSLLGIVYKAAKEKEKTLCSEYLA